MTDESHCKELLAHVYFTVFIFFIFGAAAKVTWIRGGGGKRLTNCMNREDI